MDQKEILKTVQVRDDIICKDCKFRNGGGMKYPHYTKASCEMYPIPQVKPNEVLFENGDCLYYEKEGTPDD